MIESSLHVFSAHPPNHLPSAYTKPYQTRRTHSKSRAGCSRCKEKRVRCDQKHPCCTRCARRFLDCKYETSPPSSKQSSKSPPSDISQDSPVSIDAPSPPESLGEPTRPLIKSSNELVLFKHYDTITRDALVVGPEPQKYHDMILHLSQDYSYLYHALLAIAARHLTESSVEGFSQLKHRHLSLALKEFQDVISKPIQLCDSDALVITAMLFNIFYFTHQDTGESWVYSSDPQRLDWLHVMKGQGAILGKTRPHHCRSGLLAHFTVLPKKHWRAGSRQLPQELFDLCEVKRPMGPRGVNPNPFHDIVHALALLMPLDLGIDSLIKYIHFCGRIYPDFVSLVEKNDHRALLILAYWFGLMCSVGDLWWCRRRVQRDCFAICTLLDGEGSEAIRDLLEFPASACGYVQCAQADGSREVAVVKVLTCTG